MSESQASEPPVGCPPAESESGVGDPWGIPGQQWYVLAWSHEIGRDLLERWVAAEPYVVYRTTDGDVVALDNRCAHRRYPLAKGRLVGDDVQCGYHGFVFGPDGQCVSIPSQAKVPARCRITRHPVVERSPWVWVWVGDPDRADESQVPDHPWLNQEGWRWVGGTLGLKARFQLLNENLLDLTHLTFLHRGSIGTEAVAEARTDSARDGNAVRVSRTMFSCEPAPLHRDTMGLDGLVDRWQHEEFQAPGFHIIHVGVKPAGSPAEVACEYKVLNGITPETSTHTRYFWAVSRNYAVDDDDVGDTLRREVERVFLEDIAAIEAQEVMVATDRANMFEFNASADVGVVYARRIMHDLLSLSIAPGTVQEARR